MAAGRPLANDAMTEQQCGLRGEGADPAPHALACAPLGSRGRSLGALAVRRPIPFSDADVGLLSAVADIVANAIQRAASYERMEHSLKQAQATHEISIAIAASMEAHLSLGFVLKHVLAQLGADAACVLKLKPSTRVYEYVAGRGFHSRGVEQARLRMSLGPLSQATLERRLVNIAALETEPAYAQAHALHGEELACATIAPLIAKGRVNGVLEIFYRAATQLTPSQLSFLDAVTTQAALALDNAELFAGLQQSNIELSLAYQATLEGWARALQLRDPLTETHSMQTVELTVRLARMIGIEEQGLIHVRRGAILHDIGKLGVPDNILRKPGPLTPEEWEIMRLHPQHARDLLMPIEYLRPAIDIPYCHHERWDGSGYPRGLRGVEIPLAARVFAVVDVWDALRYNRPYRPGWSGEQVKQFLIAQKGIAFDPHAVDVFVRSIDSEASDAPPAGLAGEVFLSDRD
jgi:HD-GYP domain-containing protein (c-di-GMP phosphodiesterase class II)